MSGKGRQPGKTRSKPSTVKKEKEKGNLQRTGATNKTPRKGRDANQVGKPEKKTLDGEGKKKTFFCCVRSQGPKEANGAPW